MNPRLLLPFTLLLVLSAVLLTPAPYLASATGGSSPVAAFTYVPCVMCAAPGDVVTFQGNWSIAFSGTIANYTWNFGDGTAPVTTSDPSISHMYGGTPEQWPVTLTVEDTTGLADKISQLVLFYVQPRFTLQPPNSTVGQPVNFNASDSISYQSGTMITGYSWSFGDGTTGSGKFLTHTYNMSGAYRISLTVHTASGDPSISKTIIVSQSNTPGGQTVPIDKLELIIPYLALGAFLLTASLVIIYIIRKKGSRNEMRDTMLTGRRL